MTLSVGGIGYNKPAMKFQSVAPQRFAGTQQKSGGGESPSKPINTQAKKQFFPFDGGLSFLGIAAACCCAVPLAMAAAVGFGLWRLTKRITG